MSLSQPEKEAVAMMEEEEECKTEAGVISSLSKNVVSQICSGQVITDLSSAVKELVDNALDANATRIDLKLCDLGKTWLEVSDNGTGVSPTDFASLAQKHATSKLTSFNDLESISTYGFRGEALSSLLQSCPDGGLIISTKREQDVAASRIEFDRASGKVTKIEKCARSAGTTVRVEGLFKPLPVRRKQFEKGIKAQFARMLLLLQSYAVISNGVRFSCVCVDAKGKRKVVMQTSGADSMKANIMSTCGVSLANQLVPIELEFLDEEQLQNLASSSAPSASSCFQSLKAFELDQEVSTTDTANDRENHKDLAEDENSKGRSVVRLTGFVSKFGEGIGVTSGDRQFWFVNKRPVEFPKGSKVLNSVWRQREMKHKPALFLNWEIPAGGFDINVTPDKREVFLSNEAVLLSQLKTKFESVWQRESNVLSSRTMKDLWGSATTSNSSSVSTTTLAPGGGGESSSPGKDEEEEAASNNVKDNRVQQGNDDENAEKQLVEEEEGLGEKDVPTKKTEEMSIPQVETKSVNTSTSSSSSPVEPSKSKEDVSEEGDPEDQQNEGGEVTTIGHAGATSKRVFMKTVSATSQQESSSSSFNAEDLLDEESLAMEDQFSATRGRVDTSLTGTEFRKRVRSLFEDQAGESRREEESDNDDEGSEDDGESEEETHVRKPTSPKRRKTTSKKPKQQSIQKKSFGIFDGENKEEESAEESEEESSSKPTKNNRQYNSKTSSRGKKRKETEEEAVEVVSENDSDTDSDNDKDDKERKATTSSTPASTRSRKQKNTKRKQLPTKYLVLQTLSMEQMKSTLEQCIETCRKDPCHYQPSEHVNTTQVNMAEDVEHGGSRVKGVDGVVTERIFAKSDFGVTRVLGQFNKGFIVGQTRGDLYIFDQHACDEKYRFETLQKTTKIREQPLIRPFPVDLSATDAQVVRDNLDIFEHNGFRFAKEIPNEGEQEDSSDNVDVFLSSNNGEMGMAKLKLLAIPHSLKTQFGAEDVRELASLLRENPPPPKDLRGVLQYIPPRLPRTRAMFASRACRSAIMIGDELTMSKMSKVLDNMVELEQPWNCPHGRPTMRHLLDLKSLYEKRGHDAQSYMKFD